MGILERLRQVQHFGRAEFGVRELAGDAADVITHLTAELESVTAEFEEHMTGEGLSLFEKLCAAEAELAEARKQLRDTTWQDHANHWQKRALKAEAELESTKIKYADCARLLEDAEGQVDLYKERIQQLYASHARKDVELEAWRSGRLRYHNGKYWIISAMAINDKSFQSFAAAVDALMEEREASDAEHE